MRFFLLRNSLEDFAHLTDYWVRKILRDLVSNRMM